MHRYIFTVTYNNMLGCKKEEDQGMITIFMFCISLS